MEAIGTSIGLAAGKQKVAVQGFGNSGWHFARLAHASGHTVVAVSDSKGGIYNPEGLDIPTLKKQKDTKGTLEAVGAKVVTNEELLALPVDVLVPAALENVINKSNARTVRAKLVLELANGPIDAEGDEILTKSGVKVLPDILANAGGVTVSYFEWVQNRSGDVWKEDEVHNRLKERIVAAGQAIVSRHLEKKCSLRTAAYVYALERLDEAARVKNG